MAKVILFLALIAGTIYNFDNPYIRLLLIATWAFLPLVYLIVQRNIIIPLKQIKNIYFSLLIVFLLIISLIKNLDSFNVGLSGSNSEMMTPFLFIFHVTLLYLFYQIKNFSKKFITYFFIVIATIVVIDMVVRFAQSPGLFLNYHHRQSAKNLGFFNNTNIIGEFLAFLLILSWEIKFQFKKFIQIIFSIVLITTMARSAIAAVIFIYIVKYTFKSFELIKKIIAVFVATIFLAFIIIDPLDLKHDGSLWSKIEFLQRMYELIVNGSWQDVIFGYSASIKGVIAVLNVDGHSPHVALVKSFLYYGLIGVSVWIMTLIYFIKMNGKMLYPVMGYFVFSLAGAPIFWPTLSVGLILLMIYEKIEKEKYVVFKVK